MSDQDLEFDSDTNRTSSRAGQLSPNGHWVFGSVFAGLVLVGFSFGVWAGAAKPKPPETADAKKEPEKPGAQQPPPAPKPNPPVPPTTGPGTNPDVPKPPGMPDSKMPDAPEPKPKDNPGVNPKGPDPKGPDPKGTTPEPKGVVTPKNPDPKGTVPAKAVAFKEVQPILRAYCTECHGGSTGKPKGDVDVTSIAKILKSKGPPLVVGKPDESTLYLSIKSGDMPPDGKKGPSEKELQLIRDWIASGAKERRRPVRVRRTLRPARLELTAGGDAG
jgi:periplasmic protein TonB